MGIHRSLMSPGGGKSRSPKIGAKKPSQCGVRSSHLPSSYPHSIHTHLPYSTFIYPHNNHLPMGWPYNLSTSSTSDSEEEGELC